MGGGREVEPRGMDPPPSSANYPYIKQRLEQIRYLMAQPKPMLTHHQWGQVTIIYLIFYMDVMNKIFKKKSS